MKDPETGRPLRYRLNGLPVMLLSVVIWFLLGRLEIVPYQWLYLNRWAGLAGAATLGLLASALMGWTLARGANMQKYTFKRDPEKSFLGVFQPRTVSDGTNALLCSGFWGVSRHVNYLGEILMATGLTMSLGYPLAGWAWLYPLYYVALLFTRERDDDRRCRAKYGPVWDEYVEQVPHRIVPGIY